ncbi:MAG: right-handed parallel beta-helix repeat-containing protein [Ruminococcaceae bacterium]|nr:right-handed parallel beta-helix repeat-containing protein [Oscillospiraceae bacterium]
MKKTIAVIFAMLMLQISTAYAVSVTTYKADGTDELSDYNAFYNALYFNKDTEVTVPDGTYYIGALTIPKNKTLKAEEGAKPVILATAETLFTLKDGSCLDGLTMQANGIGEIAVNISFVKNNVIKNCTIENFKEHGIQNDHGDGMRCDNLTIRNITHTGINTTFASDITVTNSYIKKCGWHGIQFWNNWEGTINGGNMLFENNTVMDIGGGGIWGTGADGIIMRNNRVDYCGDVGLDYEFCINGLMENNYVSRCQNAGLAIFYGCKNIVMRNNIVYNNWPKPTSESVLSGIWFTYKSDEAHDEGHRDIEIYNNRIYSLPHDAYSGIDIPLSNVGPHNFYIYNNVIVGNERDIYIHWKSSAMINDKNVVITRNDEGNQIEATDKAIPDYQSKMIQKGDIEITSDETVIPVENYGVGRYQFRFRLKDGTQNSSNVTVSVLGKDGVLASKSITATQMTPEGAEFSISCDAGGGEITAISLKAVKTSADITMEQLGVYHSAFPFFHVLSDRYGIEYLNNSSRKIAARLVLPYPENELGVKGRIILDKRIDYTLRDTVTISSIGK